MALKRFLMIGFVAAVLVACGDDDSSGFATRPSGDSSSACEDCDGSSSSKAKSSSSSSVTPQSSDSETSVSSSSSAKSSSSSAKSSSSSRKKGDAGTESGMTSSSAKSSSSSVASNSSVPEGYVDSTTVVKGTMTDERDGQTYKTVKIGTQTWMAENLNYAYTDVPYKVGGHISDSTSWCYDNDPANCAKYGRLYTWAAAMDSVGTWSTNGKGCGYGKKCSSSYPVRGICPEGWHLPTKAYFIALGGSGMASKMLKSASGWDDYEGKNGNGTDAYSFAALPAGYRDDDGSYYGEGKQAIFWSSTENNWDDANLMFLSNEYGSATLFSFFKFDGYSVRCLKD